MDGIDWTDSSEVGARMVEQFGVTVARLFAEVTGEVH
jgi:hypothetical protein